MEQLRTIVRNIDYTKYKTAEILYHTPIEKILCSIHNPWDMSEFKFAFENNMEFNPLIRHVRNNQLKMYDELGKVAHIEIELKNGKIKESYLDEKKDNNLTKHQVMPDDFIHNNLEQSQLCNLYKTKLLNMQMDDLLFPIDHDNNIDLIVRRSHRAILNGEIQKYHNTQSVIIQE
jgi:hypothetical protein